MCLRRLHLHDPHRERRAEPTQASTAALNAQNITRTGRAATTPAASVTAEAEPLTYTRASATAHTNLFRAGIARSGAYNRTLTPFGFQAEERTYWEAPDVYYRMSPFAHAHRISAPLLLIHGEADPNPGTFPIQSERLFAALQAQGTSARLVLLPFEGHGYRARESILHLLWEMEHWLSEHLLQSR